MHKQTPALILAAIVATFLCVGTFGSQYRAAVAYEECVGKIYGTPGCPLKKTSRTCGDGKVDQGEECDNGTARNGTGNCSAQCMFLACGDGVVSGELGEECEPKRDEVYAIDPETGELTTELRFLAASCGTVCAVPTCGSDGVCSGGCTREYKLACGTSSSAESVHEAPASEPTVTEVSSSSAAPVAPASSAPYVGRCGNGVKDPGEQCDDGNFLDTDGCTISCKLPRCGDGSVQRGEQCDDGNKLDNDGCTNRCTEPACGDGIVQEEEMCDNGGNNSNFLPNSCRGDCSAPRCGDGVTDNGEECDGGESCTADCAKIKSFSALIVDTSGMGKAAIFLSVAGAFLVLVFLFRAIVHRFVRHVAGEEVARSIDDIPLDEIEMPWHAWSARDNK